MDTIIATHKLTKHFGSKTVVNRLDLTVPRGAIYALLGDNGAGKSTTIKMLTGLLPPDGGRAEILGEDCWAAACGLRHRVGYVPERPRFYDWMSVREIGWFTAGFHHPGFYGRFLGMMDRFRLDPKAKLKALSKGGYAKVGLALALASEPEVLILDEPTSGLDLFIRREFLSSMVDLAGEGRTILISSHGIAEVERVASHAAFMAEGKLLLAAPIEELRRRLVRVRLLHEGEAPEPAPLGTVLDREHSGRQWQVVLQDPDREALDALAIAEGITSYEESPLTLEEMYTAVMARFHRTAPPPSRGERKKEGRDEAGRPEARETRERNGDGHGQRTPLGARELPSRHVRGEDETDGLDEGGRS
ncbi:MAG TPA: ATP-binding cassette domain-containing protein [Gemmataceae bacterium]|nr:ATP-binding cassette domain-containing protein [Gemmataceae bacterium]